jgi:short-subunit dehydrogenase
VKGHEFFSCFFALYYMGLPAEWLSEDSPAVSFNVTHAFMDGMLGRNRGVIIHINSPACIVTWPSSVGYTAGRMALRGLHEALYSDLRGTGVRSCHLIFVVVASSYFDRHPGVYEKIPGIARIIPQLSPETCARVIVRLAKRPQRQLTYPFMLRLYAWSYALAPGLLSWLLWRTGARREVGGAV